MVAIRVLLGAVLLGFNVQALAVEPIDDAEIKMAETLRDAALESDLAYELIRSLTTEVGPRMAGTPADAQAVAWAKANMQELGFSNIRTEPVEFPLWVRGTASAEITAPYPQPLTVLSLGFSVGTNSDGLEAKVVRFDDLKSLEAAEDDSLDGAIAFIANRMERTRDGSGYGPAVAARSRGASVAAQKGAAALLIRSIGTDDDRVAHTGVMRYADDVEKIPALALANPDADQLERVLETAGDKPTMIRLQSSAHMNGKATSYNVIGEIPANQDSDEWVIIGCHLDSWDVGTGAVDDGAGCGITMAAAYMIAQQSDSLKRGIRVVLFANEEQGLWGAKAYRDAHLNELENHVVGSESDFGAGRVWRFSTRFAPEALIYADQIAQVLAPLNIVRGDNNAFGGADMSPMRASGMAVVSLNQDGTKYFDLHHTENDTFDKIDPDDIAQNVAAWVAFTYLAAQAPGTFGSKLIPDAANQ